MALLVGLYGGVPVEGAAEVGVGGEVGSVVARGIESGMTSETLNASTVNASAFAEAECLGKTVYIDGVVYRAIALFLACYSIFPQVASYD